MSPTAHTIDARQCANVATRVYDHYSKLNMEFGRALGWDVERGGRRMEPEQSNHNGYVLARRVSERCLPAVRSHGRAPELSRPRFEYGDGGTRHSSAR